MAEKNSIWKNIRNKAAKNRRTGATPKKPTAEMLRQERKIKSKYPDGGPIKRDLYDNPIESKIVNDPTSDRSFYDPRLDQIMLGTDYDQMDDYSRERLLAHENFHGKQFKKGYSTLLPTRTTYKEPSMVSNDETYYGYHNRQRNEIKKLNSDFKKENNSFNFVPDDIIFNKVTDTAQYYDPTTIEGEAKFYEDLGADISEENKNSREFRYGGSINPYMYYSGGPMEYGRGGNFLKHVGAGAYALGEGMLDTITMGATDQLTDKGFEGLTKLGNKNMDLNDPANAKFLKTQQQIKGYGNTGAAVTTGILTGNVSGAISQGAKGLDTAFQASDWASDDFKKWSGISSKAIGIGAGLAGSAINTEGASKGASEAATKVGEISGKVSPYVNQAVSMFGSNQKPMWQQAQAQQDLLNSPELAIQQNFNNQQYVNQGLSFSHGGNITNNSLNLQSMKGRYQNYKQRMSKGGKFDQHGINFIPESAGLHHQNSYGGVPIGPDALAEGGEIKMDTPDGGQYIVSDQVDGTESQMDFTFTKSGKYKELNRTLAEGMKQDLNKYSSGSLTTNSNSKDKLRRPNDSYSKSTIDQIKQKWQQKTEFARQRSQQEQAIAQAQQEKQLIEEEFIAAYGGKINPKKYPGLNMPKRSKGGYVYNAMEQPMLAHGGPLVSNVKQPFNGPAAQNRGGMMMAQGGMMQQQGGQNKVMQLVQAYAEATGIAPEEIMQQLQQMEPQAQQQAIQQMAKELKGGQQQPMQSQQMPPQQSMARGGMMYAAGGPPDGDPNSLDYIVGASDFMYSPEFLNYWSNSEDKRNMNYGNLYEQVNKPLSEERFKPTKGISDFDRTLGNLYTAEKAKFLSSNPDGSVCYMIDGQKVCGPPGQIQAMLTERDKTYRAQAVADVYQNTTGDLTPYNYKNIPGISLSAEKPMTQPTNDFSNFTKDDSNKIKTTKDKIQNALQSNFNKLQVTGEVGIGEGNYIFGKPEQPANKQVKSTQPSNTYLRNLNTPNFVDNQGNTSSILSRIENRDTPQPIQPIQSKPFYFSKDDTTPGLVGKVSNTPPYDTSGFIPTDVIANKNANKTAIVEDNYGPIIPNNTIPKENAKTLEGLTSPQTYPDLLPPQGPYNPYGEYGFYGKNADGNDVSINPNMTNQYQTGQFTPEGYTPSPNKGFFSKAADMLKGKSGADALTAAAQLAGPLSQFFQKKPEPFQYNKGSATLTDPTAAIILSNEEQRRAQDTAGYNLKQNAPNSGSYMANMRALGLGAGKQRGSTAAGIRQQYDVNNAGILNQFEQFNTGIENANIDAMQQDQANFQEQRTNALYNAGANIAGMRKDYKANEINEIIANNIGTANYKLSEDKKSIIFRDSNNQIVTMPVEKATASTPINNSLPVGYQEKFDVNLNKGFGNRFRGSNSGK